MKCAEVSPNLPAFVLGGKEPEEAAEIQRHLATCPACRNELEEFRKVYRALQAAPPPAEPPHHLKEEILARVRAERQSFSDEAAPPLSGGYRSTYSRLVIAGVAAAAVVAVVAIGIVIGLPKEPPVATIKLIPTPGEANALEGYWGVAELRPQPSGNQRVELRLNNFEEPEPNSYYEVWFESGGKRISAGSFTSVGEGETRVSLTVAPEARNARRLLITEEHTDGDSAPSEKVALEGEIPE